MHKQYISQKKKKKKKKKRKAVIMHHYQYWLFYFRINRISRSRKALWSSGIWRMKHERNKGVNPIKTLWWNKEVFVTNISDTDSQTKGNTSMNHDEQA